MIAVIDCPCPARGTDQRRGSDCRDRCGHTRVLVRVARLGTTGAGWGPGVERELDAQLQLVRQCTATPIAVGFGISHPEQASGLRSRVDGIVVGSAIVERARGVPVRCESA